jgi:hypothetical protein
VQVIPAARAADCLAVDVGRKRLQAKEALLVARLAAKVALLATRLADLLQAAGSKRALKAAVRHDTFLASDLVCEACSKCPSPQAALEGASEALLRAEEHLAGRIVPNRAAVGGG